MVPPSIAAASAMCCRFLDLQFNLEAELLACHRPRNKVWSNSSLESV
jgi:hypothetical protein